jgi:hypothetical protein
MLTLHMPQGTKNVKEPAEVAAATRDQVRKIVEAVAAQNGTTRGTTRAKKRRTRVTERARMDLS